MSESTSCTPGVVAAAYCNEDCLQGVPGVDEAAYNEEYLGAPGVRFVPTDQELIVNYLGRKLLGKSPPTGVVRDGHNAYAEHPKKLVPKLGEAMEGSWYLFSPRQRKYPGGMRPKRAIGEEEGHWKATGAEKPVLGGAGGKEVIGTRRALTFHEDTYEVGSRGRRRRVKNKAANKPSKWKMVEFVCSNSCRAPGNTLLNDWVLCKITNRSPSVEGEGDEEQPMPDGGGEPYEKHLLPEQEQAGGGGAGVAQAGQQEQQQEPSGGGGGGGGGGGSASHGNQQPAPAAEAPLSDYFGVDLGDIFNWFPNANNMFPIFD